MLFRAKLQKLQLIYLGLTINLDQAEDEISSYADIEADNVGELHLVIWSISLEEWMV